MKEKYKYLGKNVLIFAISSFGTKFLSFFLVPFYTNVLTTEEYGMADIIITTATLMVYVFTINIADSVLRFSLERKEKQNEILSYGIRVLYTGSLMLICCLILTWWSGIIKWDLHYYVFIFFYYLSIALYQLFTNYLRATGKVTDVAIAGIISSLVMILSNILFIVVIKIGIYGYMVAMIIAPVVASLYCMFRIKFSISMYINVECDKSTQRAMCAYCIPLIFNNITSWVNAFLDKYFVTTIIGVAQNGIYAVSYKIPTILTTCYTVFSQAWSLSAIKEFDWNDEDGFFSSIYSMYNALIVCICSGLILINIPMAKVLFAKDFFKAWEYSSILLISVMFNALTAFLGSVFSAVKNSKIVATTTFISACTNVILNIVMIPIWGVQGAAIATALSYGVMWIIRLIAVQKYIKLKITLVTDVIVYILLIIQVVFEHIDGHFYLGQIVILIIIFVIYKNNIWKVIRLLQMKLWKRG